LNIGLNTSLLDSGASVAYVDSEIAKNVTQVDFNASNDSLINSLNNYQSIATNTDRLALKQNVLSAGASTAVTPLLVGNIVKSIFTIPPLIVQGNAQHVTFSLTDEFRAQSYLKAETYNKTELDSAFYNTLRTGAISKRFLGTNDEDVMVLYPDKQVELKGPVLVYGGLSVLGNSIFSNEIQLLGQTVIEDATIRRVVLGTSGCLFKTSNPDNNVMKVNYSGTVVVYNDLVVSGNISAPNLNPYHVAGRFNGIGSVNLASKGRHAFTINRLSQGFYKLSWTTPHPDGANFICFAQGEGTGSTWNILHDGNATEDLANSPTSVTFIVRNNSFALTDGIVNFAILS
jgi:hypothetical protein